MGTHAFNVATSAQRWSNTIGRVVGPGGLGSTHRSLGPVQCRMKNKNDKRGDRSAPDFFSRFPASTRMDTENGGGWKRQFGR